MPTSSQKLTGAIALTVLTSSGGLLMEYSKDEDGKYPYNKATVPLLAEMVKLAISLGLLYNESESNITTHWRAVCKYPIPALIYQITNNLSLEALRFLKPSTFQILGNLRIVTTGVLSYVLLKKQLDRVQWIALILMTLGAAASQVDGAASGTSASPVIGYVLTLVLVSLSSLAGVYTELIMKSNSDSIHWQNIQLYSFGIVVNVIRLTYDDIAAEFHYGFWTTHLLNGYSFSSWLVVLNLAMSGLLVSFVMKYVDAVAKNFSSAMAMFLTPLVSIPLFGHYPSLAILIGAGVCTISIILYYARMEDLYNFTLSKSSPLLPTSSGSSDSKGSSLMHENDDPSAKQKS